MAAVSTSLSSQSLLDAVPESLFRAFMDHSPVFAWLRDSESRYIYLNKTYLDRFGLKPEDRIGKQPADVWPQDVAERFIENDRRVLVSGRPLQIIEEAPDPDGTTHAWLNVKFPFTNGDNRLYVGGVGIDVTRERRAEEQRLKHECRLAHAQKLESLGMLAAGAAHDFNNLLTLVHGHTSMARAMLDATSPVIDHLRSIEDAARQMADLCRQMLAFSGRNRHEVRPVNLNLLIQDTARLLRGMFPRQLSIRFDLACELPTVPGDETQFRQIVMNLITNAADALGDTPGTITIRTSMMIPAAATLDEAGYDTTPRPFATLEVSDDGPGMTPAVKERVFEPFFSTKSAGRGLGLAAVAGIVRAHHGLIDVESQPGHGTTFRVLLPLA